MPRIVLGGQRVGETWRRKDFLPWVTLGHGIKGSVRGGGTLDDAFRIDPPLRIQVIASTLH